MADSASESDSSSIDGGPIMMPPSPVTREQLQKRIESLAQQNRVLKVELDTYKLRVKSLQEENRALRQASVTIVSRIWSFTFLLTNIFDIIFFDRKPNHTSLHIIFTSRSNVAPNLYVCFLEYKVRGIPSILFIFFPNSCV